MDENNVDLGVEPLADLFDLPEPYASDDRSQRWHQEIIRRMQKEASGLPMQINQIQLMERIAFFYVVMRYREFNGNAEQIDPKALEATNKPWLQMFDTFSRSIEKHKDEVLRDTILKIQDVIVKVLDEVEDDEERRRLNRTLVEELSAIGF